MPVIAAIVTHRRPAELERLLRGLAASTVPLAGCVISDHAPGGDTQRIASITPFETVVREDTSNPGPGAGWAEAAQLGLVKFPDADAVWFLDDDVVIAPDTLAILLQEAAGAQAIAPLLEDDTGKLWGFPEPIPKELRGPIREAATPADARRLLGASPIPFCWCTGACLLVQRSVIDQVGLHRRDFWMLGEDLEYSMRLSWHARAVFTCKASVPHLPPPAPSHSAARKSDYVKFCSLLQNLSYLSFHSPCSRHMRSYLPGNFRRFVRTHGPLPRAMRDAAACFLNGAIRGEPAGAASGIALRQRISKYEF
jgi:GT2 family glycosyltransferase